MPPPPDGASLKFTREQPETRSRGTTQKSKISFLGIEARLMAEEFCKFSGFASRHLPRVFSRPNRKHSLDHAFPHETPERLRIRLDNCLHHLTVSPRGSPIQRTHHDDNPHMGT